MAGEEGGEASTPFLLKNAGRGFEGRSSDVFGGLDALEQQHKAHEKNRTDLEEYADLRPDDVKNSSSEGFCDMDLRSKLQEKRQSGKTDKPGSTSKESAEADHSFRKRGRDMAKSGGISSISSHGRQSAKSQDCRFQRPIGRAPGRVSGRRQQVPNFGKGTQKWTRYSLEDVKSSDMSDKSNTQAALAFLEERRQLQEKQEKEDTGEWMEDEFDLGAAACSKGLFSFSKRSKTQEPNSVATDIPKSENRVVDLGLSEQSTETADDCDEADEGENETVVSETLSAQEITPVKPAFKNRKGIHRNIRSRDVDD